MGRTRSLRPPIYDITVKRTAFHYLPLPPFRPATTFVLPNTQALSITHPQITSSPVPGGANKVTAP